MESTLVVEIFCVISSRVCSELFEIRERIEGKHYTSDGLDNVPPGI